MYIPECEICGETCDVKVTDAGIFCLHCIDESELAIEVEDTDITEIHLGQDEEDTYSRVPLEVQEKIQRGEAF